MARARECLNLFLRNGQRQPFIGEQITRLLQGRVQESVQIVKRLGLGRERIEYLQPPRLRGEIILIHSGRLLKYVPSQNRILEGPVLMDEFQHRAREMAQGIRQGRIMLRVVGTELVAGQSASIIEVRAARRKAFFRRMWIDEKTGVRLKYENLNPQGSVVATTFFTKIDYNAVLDPKEFLPESLPDVPRAPLLPPTPPLASVSAAQQQVDYTIRQPAVPEGFRLDGVWVLGGKGPGQTTILRYTDGVNTFALFQHPKPMEGSRFSGRFRPAMRFLRIQPGAAQWMTEDRVFILVGSLRKETIQSIVASLR
jgi:hypothetical protein